MEDAASQAPRDADQSTRIEKIAQRVEWALIGAVLGPLLAVASLVFSALQWLAATEQVKVATEQVEIMRSTERPRLTVERVTNEPAIPTADQRFRVKVRIANVGRVPAEGVIWTMRLELVSRADEPDPVSPSPEGFKVIGPSDATEASVPLTNAWGSSLPPLSPSTLKQIASGQLELYLHGRVQYRVGDETTRFPFCRKFIPVADLPTGGEWSVVRCKQPDDQSSSTRE